MQQYDTYSFMVINRTYLDSSKSDSRYNISNTCPPLPMTTPGNIFSCSSSYCCFADWLLDASCHEQKNIKLLLARLESAYSLIWGVHQIWGNVLAVLRQLNGQSLYLFISADVILCNHVMCQHANFSYCCQHSQLQITPSVPSIAPRNCRQ